MSFEVEVEKQLGDRRIERGFRVADGLTVLFGPSGSGKTSILNMIAGLLRPDRGRIRLHDVTLFDSEAGIDLPAEQRGLGYVFQDSRLFPHRRVRANLLYGYRLAPPERRWMHPEEVVSFLGIEQLLDRWPRTLSGGEAQRVAIGRALLAGARALLLDEPLGSLDQARRLEIMAVIERIRDELKVPMLYVTHDRTEADRLATDIVELQPT